MLRSSLSTCGIVVLRDMCEDSASYASDVVHELDGHMSDEDGHQRCKDMLRQIAALRIASQSESREAVIDAIEGIQRILAVSMEGMKAFR